MTKITPTIRFMTPEETRAARLANAGRVIVLDGTTIPIEAGRSDQVHVFKDSTVLYVLSVNHRYDYIGMEVFDAVSGEEYNSIFFQFPWECEEYLGEKWKELSPVSIVTKLRNIFI
jgi:hypothetical protein